MKIGDEINQRNFSSEAQKAYVNIIFTSNWLQAAVRDLLKPYGLTLQQYNVLRILRGKHPECANPSEIKNVMIDKNPDLTRLCDRMVMNGWLHREIDSQNRRKMRIIITRTGLELLDVLDPVIQEHTEGLNKLSDDENKTLSDLLDKLRG